MVIACTVGIHTGGGEVLEAALCAVLAEMI